MENPKYTRLPSLIISLYKNNLGLFLRIMLPVAIIAIILNIFVYYNHVSSFELFNPVLQRTIGNSPSQSDENNPNQPENSVSVRLDTNIGISPFPSAIYKEISSNRVKYNWTPNHIETTNRKPIFWQILPYPMIGNMDDSVGWSWSINIGIIEYTPLMLLIFTLCPLSIIVASQIQASEIDVPTGTSPLTAHSSWKYTSSKALKVLIIPILFLVMTELSRLIYVLFSFILPKLTHSYLGTVFTLLQILVTIYLLITFSLYNQCIIFENRSILEIFKRSYSLVKGVRLKFLLIYLLIAWIAALVSSVLMGSALLILSIFFTELVPIQDAFSLLKFLSLFIGGDVGVILPNQLDFLPTVLILIVTGIVFMLIVPLWAIVTTYLYNERIAITSEVIEAQ
ncbi:hypothetical protein C6497_04880 [Candidatus Poribacteria bacterium]|nr:MAG: hypothetical protein C6497_04880 [Candidatus Poribacteria bacterium]